jgi:septal ring factor EnvC (AmiA/AmiB activator)
MLLMQMPDTINIVEQVWTVLIGQAVIGALILIGFIAVARRFMQVEFPAEIKDIRDDLHGLRLELRETNQELIRMRRDVDKHEHHIESLREWRRETREGRGLGLDDTRGNPSGTPRGR